MAGGTAGLTAGAIIVGNTLKPLVEGAVGMVEIKPKRPEDAFPYPPGASDEARLAIDRTRARFKEAQQLHNNHVSNDNLGYLAFAAAQPLGVAPAAVIGGIPTPNPGTAMAAHNAKLSVPSAIGGALMQRLIASRKLNATFEGTPMYALHAPAAKGMAGMKTAAVKMLKNNFTVPGPADEGTLKKTAKGLLHFSTTVLGTALANIPTMLALHGQHLAVAHLAAVWKGDNEAPMNNRIGIQPTGNSAIDALAPAVSIAVALSVPAYFAGMRLMKGRSDHAANYLHRTADTSAREEYRSRHAFGSTETADRLTQESARNFAKIGFVINRSVEGVANLGNSLFVGGIVGLKNLGNDIYKNCFTSRSATAGTSDIEAGAGAVASGIGSGSGAGAPAAMRIRAALPPLIPGLD